MCKKESIFETFKFMFVFMPTFCNKFISGVKQIYIMAFLVD